MKKIVSLVIALALVLSFATISASACYMKPYKPAKPTTTKPAEKTTKVVEEIITEDKKEETEVTESQIVIVEEETEKPSDVVKTDDKTPATDVEKETPAKDPVKTEKVVIDEATPLADVPAETESIAQTGDTTFVAMVAVTAVAGAAFVVTKKHN